MYCDCLLLLHYLFVEIKSPVGLMLFVTHIQQLINLLCLCLRLCRRKTKFPTVKPTTHLPK